MQISENVANPEKANLLKEKREKKKKRYSGQKQHEVKSGDTSSSERHLKEFKAIHQQSYSQPKSQSVFHSEKRDSWWTWGDAEKNQEDTCSCVSCALKKIITQRSGIMSCLAIILALSGIVAIYLVICTMPKTYVDKKGVDLGRKYEDIVTAKPADKRERRSEIGLAGRGMQDRAIWDDSKSRLMSGLSDLYGADFSENSLHDGGNIQEGARGVKTELNSILDPNKLSEGYGSNRLRNFYKKLIQTDMQIRNLKKSIRETKPDSNSLDLGLSRAKRSLVPGRRFRSLVNISVADQQAFEDLHVYFPPAPVIQVPKPQGQKTKRFINESGPSGFMIENKKLVVKFKQYPKRHKVPYHSHAYGMEKDDDFHPQLKDTSRFDEILSRLIEKNVPDAVFDPFGLRTINPLLTTGSYPLSDDYMMTTEQPLLILKPKKNKVQSKQKTTVRPTNEAPSGSRGATNNFGKYVSMSTILNTEAKKSLDLISRVPNIRRLMQVEVDENEEGTNDEGDREKRTGASDSDVQIGTKYRPPAIHNPNWKGPMPLYPDELNSIIKQAAMENIHKVEVPVNKDSVADNAKDISDTEYVEDYVNNKYDKLVKMAQAYSDYGVLEDKKDMRVEKNNKAIENRVKLSVQKGLGLLGRLKKNAAFDSEGIRFEYKPKLVMSKNDKASGDFFKFGSHLKLTPNKVHQPERESNVNIKNCEFLYTNPEKAQKGSKDSTETTTGDYSPVYYGRHKRSLMSFNEEDMKDTIGVNNDAETKYSNIEHIYETAPPNAINNKEYNTYTTSSSISETDTDGLLTEIGHFNEESLTEPKLENTPEVPFKLMHVNASEDINEKNNNTNMKHGDMFGLIIDWFKILSGLEMDGDHVNETNVLTDFLSMLNPEKIPIIPIQYSVTKGVKTTNIKPMYPILDAEMVENIGHRSRVLMSVEDKVDNATIEKDEKKHKTRSGERVTDRELTNATSTEINKIANTSNVDNTIDNKAADAAIEKKTVKKRSASDNSNLIFWNDMYDDEYGVKDPLEDSIRDKHSARFNDVISKSENWFGVKLRKIADRMRNKKRGDGEIKKEPDLRYRSDKIFKRDALFEEADNDKQSFSALTANMKKVCREAAQAVHRTRNIEVSAKSTEGEAASTLMQQLVGLMSDLVDIQVQQKTCVPLPPDLRSFLVWLTSTNPEENPQMQSFDELSTAQPTETFTETTPSDIYPLDVRTECLGTIHDVEDLIQLYDEMSEEDKSKMSGVREYLENQLDFLHKQLSSFDGYKSVSPAQIRRRRQSDPGKQRIRRKLNRFFKRFGRKRTKSTVNFDTFEPFTDYRKTSTSFDDGYTKNGYDDKVKRNLPDVYYKALAEANNATTMNISVPD